VTAPGTESAVSVSQMGRFETKWLGRPEKPYHACHAEPSRPTRWVSMRTLAMPKAAKSPSMTGLRGKLIKIGAKIENHKRGALSGLPDGCGVAVSRQMFDVRRHSAADRPAVRAVRARMSDAGGDVCQPPMGVPRCGQTLRIWRFAAVSRRRRSPLLATKEILRFSNFSLPELVKLLN